MNCSEKLVREKSKKQQLFEKLRHMVASRHQAPEDVTEWELMEIIAMLDKKEVIVCVTVL